LKRLPPGIGHCDDHVPSCVGRALSSRPARHLASGTAVSKKADDESPLAAGSPRPAGRWNEIQAMFVDDPRACVELAAGLVDDRVEAHVMSVRERQHWLLSAWQGDDAGTEDLRVTLQHYRAFWSRLEDFSGKT
jgi:hypothetical protein